MISIYNLTFILQKILQSFTETLTKIAEGDMKFDDEKTTELLNLYMRARVAFEKFANDMEVETPSKKMNKFTSRRTFMFALSRPFPTLSVCRGIVEAVSSL